MLTPVLQYVLTQRVRGSQRRLYIKQTFGLLGSQKLKVRLYIIFFGMLY